LYFSTSDSYFSPPFPHLFLPSLLVHLLLFFLCPSSFIIHFSLSFFFHLRFPLPSPYFAYFLFDVLTSTVVPSWSDGLSC
jgi:hypothetical protein